MKKFLIALCSIILLTAANKNCDDIECHKNNIEEYKKELIDRYSLDEEKVNEILKQDQEENENIYEIMQLIGKRRGAIISGGNIDDEKTSRIILEDFRGGKIGKITLEKII